MHVIGTAGHVDHGKSALVTRLTGMDPDRFEEEKRRGLTIDLGFAWLTLPSGLEVGLVDVPGHERFIGNMLAGAGGITVCLFVVSATEGWMPQSAEHLTALEVLGVASGLVALTKSDLVDDETLELARLDVAEHLAGTTLEGAPVLPVSSITGAGIEDLVATLDGIVREAPGAPDEGRARLWVDRVFTIAGAGTVVTGTGAGGSFSVGEEVEAQPRGHRARIRSIQTHQKDVDSIGPGNRVALNLVGLDRDDIARGDAVVKPGTWRSTKEIDAQLVVPDVDITGHGHTVKEKGAYRLHAGSAETAVRLRLLERGEVRVGESAPARIHLSDPLTLGRGDRFVLRDAGRVLTVGGGVVLDPQPARVRRGDRAHVEMLARLVSSDASTALAELVTEAGALPADQAAFRAGLPDATRPGFPLPEGVVRLGHILVSTAKHADLRAGALGILGDFHAAHPLEPGMMREGLRSLLDLDHGAFEALLSSMDEIDGEASIVRLAGHRVELDPAQEAETRALMQTLEDAGFSPPAAADLGADPALLKALAGKRDIVRVGNFYLSARRAAEVRALVRARIEEAGAQTVAEIRDLLGTSRKYAIPLCEWLDETGVTRRKGDVRELGPRL